MTDLKTLEKKAATETETPISLVFYQLQFFSILGF
jgi:hypothetical protein